VESISPEPATGPALELAHGPRPTQRHGRAHPLAQTGATGLDSSAATPLQITDAFRARPPQRRVGLGRTPGGMRLGATGSPATARSQSARPTKRARSTGGLSGSLPLPGLPQPGRTEPAVLGV
jgi:hypothetical protein